MRLVSLSIILSLSACASDGIKGPQYGAIDDSAEDFVVAVEDCQDQVDNDLDGSIDCFDEDCVAELNCIDADEDGHAADVDCDDADPYTYPGAAEMESMTSCMTDSDEDGYGDAAPSSSSAEAGHDCDDSNPDLNPAAEEILDDGVDQDCDGIDATANVDSDNDGHGALTDCDDSDPATYPGAAEMDSETACMTDYDQDGYGDAQPSNPTVSPGTDCDDSYFSINPGAVDSLGDGIDSNCDGADGNNQGGQGQDNDGDGFAGSSDCNDSDASIYPGAFDMPGDGIDQDCDGQDGSGGGWTDNDGDGYDSFSDCNDFDPTVYPGAFDIPGDGIDQDCDGVDGGGNVFDQDGDGYDVPFDCDDASPWTYPGAAFMDSSVDCMIDADFDGYGDAFPFNSAVTPGTDCDDSDYTVFPGAYDVSGDGIDSDCDGLDSQAPGMQDSDFDGFPAADDCDDADPQTYPGAAWVESYTLCMRDADYDGFGDSAPANTAVTAGTDCDDNAVDTNPGAYDAIGDGIDQNCDGTDGGSGTAGPMDFDFDGWDASVDCNDNDYTINPGASELWNTGVDENCDGVVDFTLTTGIYEFSSPVTLNSTCGPLPVSLGTSTEAITPIVGGIRATGALKKNQSCLFDGLSFVSQPEPHLLDLSAYGFDAALELTIQTDVAELSPTEVNLYETIVYSGSCTGTDCAVVTALFTPNCEIELMSEGTHAPVSSNMCCYDLMMNDSYGDGWNYASLDHYENGVLLQSSTLSSGSSGMDIICLQDGSLYELSFNSGAWDSEISYELSYGSNLLHSGTAPNVGLQYSATVVCQ